MHFVVIQNDRNVSLFLKQKSLCYILFKIVCCLEIFKTLIGQTFFASFYTIHRPWELRCIVWHYFLINPPLYIRLLKQPCCSLYVSALSFKIKTTLNNYLYKLILGTIIFRLFLEEKIKKQKIEKRDHALYIDMLSNGMNLYSEITKTPRKNK